MLSFKNSALQKGEILTIGIDGVSGDGWGRLGFSPFACEAQPPTAAQNLSSRSPAWTYSKHVQTTTTDQSLISEMFN